MTQPNQPPTKNLAKQISELIASHDQAGRELNSLAGARRAFLAGGQGHTGDHCADEARLQSLNRDIQTLNLRRERIEVDLWERLPQVVEAVTAANQARPDPSASELLQILANEDESALVRCERGVEFLLAQ